MEKSELPVYDLDRRSCEMQPLGVILYRVVETASQTNLLYASNLQDNGPTFNGEDKKI